MTRPNLYAISEGLRVSGYEWFAGKQHEPLLLSIEEGYELGRIRFEEMLKAADVPVASDTRVQE